MPTKTARTAPAKLTAKQALFVAEYPKDFNGTQAAIRAGYSAKTANREGARLLTNAVILDAMRAAQAARIERIEVSVDYVVDNAREVLERCMERAPVMIRDPITPGRMTQQMDDDGNHVWQFDAKNAIGALTLLSRHTGGFSEKHEHSGPAGAPVAVTVTRRIVRVTGQ